jgi:hypothetical protein
MGPGGAARNQGRPAAFERSTYWSADSIRERERYRELDERSAYSTPNSRSCRRSHAANAVGAEARLAS